MAKAFMNVFSTISITEPSNSSKLEILVFKYIPIVKNMAYSGRHSIQNISDPLNTTTISQKEEEKTSLAQNKGKSLQNINYVLIFVVVGYIL